MLVKTNNQSNNIYKNRLRSYSKNQVAINEIETVAINKIENELETVIKNENEIDSDPLCFFCLELSKSNNLIVKMKNIDYISHCDCNGNVHPTCLINWFIISNSCPICREEIFIDLEVLDQIQPFYKYTIIISKCKQQVRYYTNRCYAALQIVTKFVILLFCVKTVVTIMFSVHDNILNKNKW